jgi:hypothetical protein
MVNVIDASDYFECVATRGVGLHDGRVSYWHGCEPDHAAAQRRVDAVCVRRVNRRTYADVSPTHSTKRRCRAPAAHPTYLGKLVFDVSRWMVDDQFTVKQPLAQVNRARAAMENIAYLSRNIATARSPCEQKKAT